METIINIFMSPPGSTITIFPMGVMINDVKLVCPCGLVRSDINILPIDICPKCSSNLVKVKIKGLY